MSAERRPRPGLLRRLYGAGPLQLLALVASFALAGAALSKLLDAGTATRNVVLWLVGAILLHDFVLFPLTALLDRVAGRSPRLRGVPAVNYLRVPTLLAGLLFLVWFPLILGLSTQRYEGSSALTTDVYLPRWLAITGVLFAASAVLYAVRVRSGTDGATGAAAGPSWAPHGGEGDGSAIGEPPGGDPAQRSASHPDVPDRPGAGS